MAWEGVGLLLTPLIQIMPGWPHPLTGKSLEETSKALEGEPSPLRIDLRIGPL